MSLIALSSGLKKHHYDIINRIAENILYKPIEIIDLKSYSPDINGGDIILLFGTRAKKFFQAKKYTNPYLILPEVANLEDEPENERKREKAWEALLEFKELLDSQVTLTSEQLSELTASDVVGMEILLKQKGVTEWFGKMKDGKTLCLSVEPTKDNGVDVALTFAELYAIKTAMEVLEVEEITIGSNNKRIGGSNNN
jgi:hypothetical protein